MLRLPDLTRSHEWEFLQTCWTSVYAQLNIFACVYAHKHTHTHTHTHTHSHPYVHTCIHTHTMVSVAVLYSTLSLSCSREKGEKGMVHAYLTPPSFSLSLSFSLPLSLSVPPLHNISHHFPGSEKPICYTKLIFLSKHWLLCHSSFSPHSCSPVLQWLCV